MFLDVFVYFFLQIDTYSDTRGLSVSANAGFRRHVASGYGIRNTPGRSAPRVASFPLPPDQLLQERLSRANP